MAIALHVRVGWIVALLGVHGAPAFAAEAAPAAAGPAPHFDVLEIRVAGNTVLPTRRIEQAVYPHVGPDRTLADVQAAQKDLEQAYRDAGFSTVFVDLPEQSVDQGIVHINVTEGRLGRVRISGARYYSSGKIVSSLPSLAPGEVPDFGQLQRDLAALNQASADRMVTPVLRAGSAPGTVDVDLKVADTLPLHGGLEVNDRYSKDTTRTRLSADIHYDNLWQRFHSFSLQYQTAPEKPGESDVLAATYVAPFGRPGQALAGYLVSTNSDVSTVGTLAVLGAGTIAGLRLVEPLPTVGNLNHGMVFGLDYKKFDENVRVTVDQAVQTPIDYANWSVAYNGAYRHDRDLLALNTALNFGLRGVANDAAEFENKRYRARPNYVYLRGDARYDRTLAGDASHALRLEVRLSGQATTEPLISNEQFAIGGATTVRGYLEATELGDYGVTSSVELQWPFTAHWIPEGAGSLYLLGFVDGGVVRTLSPLPDQPSGADLSSFGLGLRAVALHGFDADLDWAYPLVWGGDTAPGDWRLLFRFRYGF